MVGDRISISEFSRKVMEEEKFRYDFFSSQDPAQLLQSLTGIIIPDDQKEDFKNYVNDLKDKYTRKTIRYRTEEEREIYEITVEVPPPG